MLQIETAIKAELVKVSNGDYKGDPAWTLGIMSELTRVAYDEFNCNVYGKKCYMDDTITECLYDMVWYTPMPLDYLPENRRNIIFREIHLVLECEWKMGLDEIMYDFQKLVQARADLRVMIFQSRDTNATMDTLTRYLEAAPSSVRGDQYLFAGFDPRDGEFNFRSVLKA
jgi:hypothetical protein